jgi:hypothetical protein
MSRDIDMGDRYRKECGSDEYHDGDRGSHAKSHQASFSSSLKRVRVDTQGRRGRFASEKNAAKGWGEGKEGTQGLPVTRHRVIRYANATLAFSQLMTPSIV